MVFYGEVAAVAVASDEDGAHHISAEIFQVMNDVGFTIPPMRWLSGWERPWATRISLISGKLPTLSAP